MIGVTQLMASPLAVIPNSQANPYNSFADVASSETTNGYYWIIDSAGRVRNYYFCVDGSECGNTSGAWARIDSTWATLGGHGGEPAPGYPKLTSDGTIGIACLNNNGGSYSSNHGGARVSSNTPFRMKKFILSNLSLTSNGTWGGVTFPNTRLYIQPDSIQTFAMTNPNASHYPGWYPSTNWGDLVNNATGNNAVYLIQQASPPTSTVTAPNNGSVGFAQGIVYNVNSTYHNQDLIWMLGHGSYSSGQNRPANLKFWFQE